VKRVLVLSLLLALAPGPALAFDLGAVLDAIASQVCGLRSSVEVPGSFTITLPIGSMVDLQGFCRSYEVYKRGKNFGKALGDAGRLALQNIFQGFVDAFAGAFGQALKPALDPLNDLLQAFAKQANGLLNAPYIAASAVYGLVYSSAYEAIYESLNDQAASPRVSVPSEADAAITPVDGDLAARYAYPDAGEVARMNQAIEEGKASTSSVLSDAAAIADNAARAERAKAKAEELAQEVKDAASREAVRQAISGQAETARKVAEAASQVTSKDPVNLGKAELYRKEAENAPSDRALLELQVKALADIMEQQGIYTSYTSELLVQQSKLQAMTTRELKEAIESIQRGQREAVAWTTSAEAIETYWESALERAKADTEPMRALLTAVCAFYSGGETAGCY
jgi:3'-phosphoadenosine 5'-phosphosulfate sulfotransferase